MAKALVLFMGSPEVGPYVNAMAHAVDSFGIDRIVLVQVVGAPTGLQVDFDAFVNVELATVVSQLADGQFSEKAFSVPAGFRAYSELKRVYGTERDLRRVNYQFLRDSLMELKALYGTESIIDISGLPKRVAIDVLTGSLAVGLERVMLFELKKRGRGLDALYHALHEADYVNSRPMCTTGRRLMGTTIW
jgi:hypothetical protein